MHRCEGEWAWLASCLAPEHCLRSSRLPRQKQLAVRPPTQIVREEVCRDLRFDRTPGQIQGPAPRIGEHSAIILAELGLEAAEIERLAAEQIVRLVRT